MFNGTAVDGPVLYGNAGGVLGSNVNGTQNTALRWNAAGQVGIGSATLAGATATNKLVLQGDDATTPPQQLVIRGATDTNRQLLVGFQTTNNFGSLQAYGAAATATGLALNPSGGNVGIGTGNAAPAQKLDVVGNIAASGSITAASMTGNGAGLTALDAGRITAGTLADGRLSGNVELLNASQTASAFKAFTGHLGMGYFNDSNPGTTNYLTYANRVTDTFPAYGVNVANYGLTLGSNGQTYLTSYGIVRIFSQAVEKMTIGANGFVGVLNNNPTAPLHVAGSVNHTWNNGYYFNAHNGTSLVFFNPGSANVSIKSNAAVEAEQYFAVSDARIKNIQGRSDGAADLATLSHIEVANYTYKDQLANSSGLQKKVIAQQVEAVYPQAVSRSTNVVPDIYQKATVREGWVTLSTDLKVGERVRLMAEKEEGVHEVLEVRSGAFRTDFRPATEQVFVYGREVKDFRTVDYDALSMLNVSATQQLKKETDAEIKLLRDQKFRLEHLLETQRELLSAQEKRIAELETRDKLRESRLAAIEQLLIPEKKVALTVSLEAPASK